MHAARPVRYAVYAHTVHCATRAGQYVQPEKAGYMQEATIAVRNRIQWSHTVHTVRCALSTVQRGRGEYMRVEYYTHKGIFIHSVYIYVQISLC
jgi:hypothetical protein